MAVPRRRVYGARAYLSGLHPSLEAFRERVANLATEIEEDAVAARRRIGVEPVGAAAILAQAPVSGPLGDRECPPTCLREIPSEQQRKIAVGSSREEVRLYRRARR